MIWRFFFFFVIFIIEESYDTRHLVENYYSGERIN